MQGVILLKVKALQNILYKGAVYPKDTVFEMDEVSVGIAGKYGKIEKLDGGADEPVEGDVVKGLPPLKKQK